MEEWEQLYEFPDYEVSSYGQFRNLRTGRTLSISSNGQGVLKVVLMKDGKPHTRSAAKLIALTFHGEPPPENTAVVYLDYDWTNIHKDNLEWKPRWFAQERALQAKRIEPLRRGRILMESTGVVYEDSLQCARDIDGIEKYIVLCASSPDGSRYMSSSYRWVD